MPIREIAWITRDFLRRNPKDLVVFGDNLRRVGLGGQAKEARGEPNAIGIPTKVSPSQYLYDSDFEKAKEAIESAFQTLTEHLLRGGLVWWPTDGVGTGLARLDATAPRIWLFMKARENELFARFLDERYLDAEKLGDLIQEGRYADAEKLWAHATADLGGLVSETSRNLHRTALAAWLDVAEIGRARKLFDGIPEALRAEASFVELQNKLERYEEGFRFSFSVRPSGLSFLRDEDPRAEDRRKSSLLPDTFEGLPLWRWYAFRVVSITEGGPNLIIVPAIPEPPVLYFQGSWSDYPELKHLIGAPHSVAYRTLGEIGEYVGEDEAVRKIVTRTFPSDESGD